MNVTTPPISPTQYSTAGRSNSARFTATLGSMALLSFPLVFTAAMTPHYEEIFRDFGVAIPLLTRWFIGLGNALATPLGWAMVAAVIALVIVPISIGMGRRWSGAMILLGLSLLLGAAYMVLFMISMQMPLTAVQESLRQN